jgi:FAD/FMN-containing dehydrogenase/Fe-S oxidoreductase
MLKDLLKNDFSGEILEDAFTRGRYATDASIYQMMPAAVAIPRSTEDISAALSAARQTGISVTGRGGGTSQCGQTVNSGLILDNSEHFNKILDIDVAGRRAIVQPGVVLDELNKVLKPHGLWFPVDISTASRATIGGMAANNSCGGRSLRYGTMRTNVLGVEAILADGTLARFGEMPDMTAPFHPAQAIIDEMMQIGSAHSDLIEARFPKLNRRVGGYNLDALVPGDTPNNLSHLLVGSEGTLAYFTEIELKLSPLVGERVLAVCHFADFHQAMNATQHLVALNPLSVELVDNTMIALSRQIPMFRRTIEAFVEGAPAALLLVEFDEGSADANARKLRETEDCMGSLGFAWSGTGARWGGVKPITDQRLQGQIAEVRKSGLNIMMSMKQDGKPVSFVEDCAVPLTDLADYTARLTDVFSRHGTQGTWYAHASVGCLHVRPVLNLKQDAEVKKMRAIAEEAFALVAEYKGSHSGEHGDGIVRSEFHERMFGTEITDLFRDVKQRFDPDGVLNPGKIVDAPKMDDRSLFRYSDTYQVAPLKTAFDWSDWTGAGGGFQGAVEMCNNNGACRKISGGSMCPSYRATRNERDSTRGRANSLRLAISGQLGADALTSSELADTMKLCVSCKACKRECPTGVDMARMKTEVQAARVSKHGLSLHDRLVGYLPRYAPWAARVPWLMNLRNRIPGLAALTERATGFAASRNLPVWSSKPFRDAELDDVDPDVVLFADAFNRYFEPENLRSAGRVLRAAGLNVKVATPIDGRRPLDCGRTLLSVGLLEEARREAERLVEALLPYAQKGIPIVGLEPSSILSLRDEIPALITDGRADIVSENSFMLEEYLIKHAVALPLRALGQKILLHGHCHQKAHQVMPDVLSALGLIPNSDVEVVESSCCGMAGAFGYGRDTADISLKMADASLLPAVRAAPHEALIVADGTSCRHQIADGTGRKAIHVARVLEMALTERGV